MLTSDIVDQMHVQMPTAASD